MFAIDASLKMKKDKNNIAFFIPLSAANLDSYLAFLSVAISLITTIK